MFALLAPYRILIEAAAAAALVLAIWMHGHHAGATHEIEKCSAAERVRLADEASRKEANDRAAGAAATRYEAATAAITARHAHAAATRREALAAPACPAPGPLSAADRLGAPASAPDPSLGGLRVPAAVVDSLRDAAGQLPPEPTSREPRAAVLSGAPISAAFGFGDAPLR
jgi:hypothetical protein